MNIALSIARWILAIGISAALSFWIFIATINATLANREVVKSWLAESGAYGDALGTLLTIEAQTSSIPPEILQESLVATFDAEFQQQTMNTIIDAVYNWAEGSASAVTFSIPMQEKSAEYSQHLIDLLMPKLLELPVCTGRVQMTTQINCIPPGVEPISYAQMITRQASEADFLKQPLTQESLKGVGLPQLPWLPQTLQGVHTLMWVLPVSVIVLSGLFIAASPDKLRGVIRVSRRITVGAAVTLVGGLFLWYVTTSIDLSNAVNNSSPQAAAITNTFINPIARTILPDVGMALSFYSGVVVVIAGLVWLVAFIWRHKRNSTPPTIGGSPVPVPPPPSNNTEAQLPHPFDRP